MERKDYPQEGDGLTESNAQLIIHILANQRSAQSQFKMLTGLNRSDVELIAYASQQLMFTAYEAHRHFASMNIQQARRTISKLVNQQALELLRQGSQGKAAIYCLTMHGKTLLTKYLEYLS